MPRTKPKQQSTDTSSASIFDLCLQLMTGLFIQVQYPKSQGLWFIFLMTCAALTEQVRGQSDTITLHGKPKHDEYFVIDPTQSKTVIHGFEVNRPWTDILEIISLRGFEFGDKANQPITDRLDISLERIKDSSEIELVNQGKDSELIFPSGHRVQLIGVNWETLLHHERWYNFFKTQKASAQMQQPNMGRKFHRRLELEYYEKPGLRYPHTEVTYLGHPHNADTFRLLPLPTQRTVITNFDTQITRQPFDIIDISDSGVTDLGQIKISLGDSYVNLTFPNGQQVQLHQLNPIPLLEKFTNESIYNYNAMYEFNRKPFYFYVNGHVVPGKLQLENPAAKSGIYDANAHLHGNYNGLSHPISLSRGKTIIIKNFDSVFRESRTPIRDTLKILDFSEIEKTTNKPLEISEDNYTAIISHNNQELARMPNFDARKLCQLAEILTKVTGFSQVVCNINDFIYLLNSPRRIYLGAVRKETLAAGLPFLEQLSLHTNLFEFDVVISLKVPLEFSLPPFTHPPDDLPFEKYIFSIKSPAKIEKLINELKQAIICVRPNTVKLPKERSLQMEFEKVKPRITKYPNATKIEISLEGETHQVHVLETGKFPLSAPYPLLPQFSFRKAAGAWKIGLPPWVNYEPTENTLVGKPSENQTGTTLIQATWTGEQGMEREWLDITVLPPLTWWQWLMVMENASQVFKEIIKLFTTLYVLVFTNKYTQQFQQTPRQYGRFFQDVKGYHVVSQQDIDDIYQEYKVIEQNYLHNVYFMQHLLKYAHYFQFDFSDRKLVIREKIFSTLKDKYPASSSRQPTEQIDSELKAEIIFTILLKEFCGIEGYGQLHAFFKLNSLGEELEEIETNILTKLFNHGGFHKITDEHLIQENGDAVVKWNQFISSIADTHIKFYDPTKPEGGIGIRVSPPLTFLAYQNAIMFYVFELLYRKGVTQEELAPYTPLPGPS